MMMLMMKKAQSWHVSLKKWDAVIFEALRDVIVYGVGVYAPYDDEEHKYTLKYKWLIQSTPNGDTIEESKEYTAKGDIPMALIDKKYFKFRFTSVPEGVRVKAG